MAYTTTSITRVIRRQSPTIVVGILFAILTVVWYHGSREDGNNVGKHEEHQTITPLDHSTVHDPRQPAVAKMHDGQDTAAVVVRQVIDSNRILMNATDTALQSGTFLPGCPVQPQRAPLQPFSAAELKAFITEHDLEPVEHGTLAVIGIAKNIGTVKIDRARSAIEVFAEVIFGGSFHVFFLENDSDDCTGSKLLEWQRDDPDRVHVVSERRGAPAPRVGDHLKRIQMLASYRNRVVAHMTVHPAWPSVTHVLVVDLDIKPWAPNVLLEPFRKRVTQLNWDMLCANGVMSEYDNRYYDAFAFRSARFPLGPTKVRRYFGKFGYVKRVMEGMAREPTAQMEPVQSCFGGLAFYKANLIEHCRYASPDGDCEHVHLHACMRKKFPGSVFGMLPAMRVVYDLDMQELVGYDVKLTP